MIQDKISDHTENAINNFNLDEKFRKVDRIIEKLEESLLKSGDVIDKSLGTGDYKGLPLKVRISKANTLKKEQTSKPKKGDIIGIDRGVYTHYATYLGKGRVIHYSTIPGALQENTIIETDMDNFLRGETEYFVFNCENKSKEKLSSMSPADFIVPIPKMPVHVIYTPEETIQRAKSRLGENEYNLALNNCEHFAIWCKTGESVSYQGERIFGRWKKISTTSK